MDIYPLNAKQGNDVLNDRQWQQKENYRVDALMLLGVLHCQGTDQEKAEVFIDIVQPDIDQMISFHENQLKNAIFNMCLISTLFFQYVADVNEMLEANPADPEISGIKGAIS